VDACPVHAFTGNNFNEEKPRDYIYDAAACNSYMKERRLSLLGKNVFGGNCGLCIQVCPFGKPKRPGSRDKKAGSLKPIKEMEQIV
jgi:epoxyqueuosine reductase QueG